MQNLTERENEIYKYICETMEANGYAPSVRDIKAALGIKSTATVHSYLTKLEMKGYIHKEQGKSRTLRVDADGMTGQPSVRSAVVGQVAAGLRFWRRKISTAISNTVRRTAWREGSFSL